jgi:ring-1,2-phenylacetyl-CoA epoxidase subunit PaaC
MVRQFLFDATACCSSRRSRRAGTRRLAAIAAKALKEDKYHLRHSSEWVVRLGDGTEESHARVQASLDDLWRYTGELFASRRRSTPPWPRSASWWITAAPSRWDAMVNDVLAARHARGAPSTPVMQRRAARAAHGAPRAHACDDAERGAAHPGATW